MRLENKVAFISGGALGMGAVEAKLFAAEGARVVIGDVLEEEGRKTEAEINELGGECLFVRLDVTSQQDWQRAVAATVARFGRLDVLVNNAALTYFIPVKDYPVRRWMRSWAVNFHAPFMLSQMVLGEMIEAKCRSIVNISSGAALGPGRGPYPGAPAGGGGTCYGAEKAALERFTQGLAQEVYQYGISVTCVSPSQVVPTPGTVFHNLVTGMDDPRGEHPDLMARSALLLATEPLDKVSGRVAYSQQILKEFGWINEGKGTGIDREGSGYSLA